MVLIIPTRVKKGRLRMKLKEIPKECVPCVNKHMCLEYGFSKDREGCLARSQPSEL